MRVLVTGGAGYIGSVTTELLLDAGHEVTVLDNLERGHREAVDRRADFRRGDLRDRDGVLAALETVKPDAVMHFAAYALVPESMDVPERYFHNNVCGGVYLAEAMLRSGVRRIVFSSTCATYGTPDALPIVEDLPQRPESPYGESKLMLERVLQWYAAQRGLRPVFLRYFNACGATAKFGEHHDPETHLIPRVLAVALGQAGHITVYGDDYPTPDGTCVRDYVHIEDLAQAHILALEKDVTGAFNLGNGDGHSVREVIETARAVTGRPIPLVVAPRRPGDPPRLVASAEKARRVLGWTPRSPDLRAIIASAWAWHQRHPRGYAP